jgi:integrase
MRTVRDALTLAIEDWSARGVGYTDTQRAGNLLKTEIARLPLEDVTPSRLRLWLLTERRNGRNPGGIIKVAQVLTRALKLAHEEGWIPQAIRCPTPKPPPPRVEHFTPEEMAKVLREAREGVYKDGLKWLYLTTCRSKDMRTLEWRDTKAWQEGTGEYVPPPDEDRGYGYVTFKRTKSQEPRTLPLTEALVEILARRWEMRSVSVIQGQQKIAEHPPSAYVFHYMGRPISGESLRRHFNIASNAAGFHDRRVHDLRRSGITALMHAGVPAHVAMQISGHRSYKVFMDYCQSRPEDLYEALEKQEDSLHARKGRFRFHEIENGPSV